MADLKENVEVTDPVVDNPVVDILLMVMLMSIQMLKRENTVCFAMHIRNLIICH